MVDLNTAHGWFAAVSGLIAAHGLKRIDLLKIDVEGDELQVLQGVAQQDWDSIKQVVRVIVVLGVVIIVFRVEIEIRWLKFCAVGCSVHICWAFTSLWMCLACPCVDCSVAP